MTWLMVVPVIDPANWSAFIEGCKLPHDQILVVDNASEPLSWDGRLHRDGSNLGVAGSWNVGVRTMLDEGVDWLIIASSSYRFGPSGGFDLVDALDGCERPGIWTQHGWHRVAVARSSFETVGLFDEGFWPAYYEENDWMHRAFKLGLLRRKHYLGRTIPDMKQWRTINGEGDFGRQAAALTDGFVSMSMARVTTRYIAKWGGEVGLERYKEPFNGEPVPDWWFDRDPMVVGPPLDLPAPT